MNYRQGFKRIYTVLLICWMLFWIVALIAIFANNQGPIREEQLAFILLVVVVPPILVYVLGFVAFPWIKKGFK